jgi:hypothetical protein
LCAFSAQGEAADKEGEAPPLDLSAVSQHIADWQSYRSYLDESDQDTPRVALQFDSGTLEGLHRFVDFWPSIHWLSAANVATSIASLGYTWRNLKLEGALFRGQEAGRRNTEFIKLDSTSARLAYKLAPNWSLRVSRGYQNSPDQLAQPATMHRTTASATYYGSIAGNPWNTTMAWGRGEDSLNGNAYLMESAMRLDRRHTIFTRLERAGNGELFPEEEAPHQQSYRAQKISVGYLYDIVDRGPTRFGIGASISKRTVPDELTPYYNGNNTSRMIFLRLQMQLSSK